MSDTNRSDTSNNRLLPSSSPTKVAVKERLGRVRKIMQSAVQTATSQAMAELKDEFKDSINTIQAKVIESDRYNQAKHSLDRAVGWYKSATANAEAQGVDLLQTKQAHWEHQVGQMGGTVAQKEQQIRQRLRSWLLAIVAKR
jgi:hypothetical protein